MNIIYTSENKIYSFENSNKTEIPCGRVIKYKETLDSIRRRSEWKTTGSGPAGGTETDSCTGSICFR